MINSVSLTGRLTRDPDLRYTQTGMAVCNLNLAVERKFKNSNGERETDFPNLKAFGKTAETLANYLKKGSLAGFEGRIQTGSYENQEGKRVYTTDVIVDSFSFLETRSKSEAQQQSKPKQEAPQMEPIEIDDDDIEDSLPF
jgi:single-strand DNA-binding protein